MANQLLDPDNPARANDGTLRSVEEMVALGVEFPHSPSSITNLFDSKQPHAIESSESDAESDDGLSKPVVEGRGHRVRAPKIHFDPAEVEAQQREKAKKANESRNTKKLADPFKDFKKGKDDHAANSTSGAVRILADSTAPEIMVNRKKSKRKDKAKKHKNKSDTDSSADEGEPKTKKKSPKPRKKKRRTTNATSPGNDAADETGYASADQRTTSFRKADLARAEAAHKSRKTDRTLDLAGVFADVEEFEENGVTKKRRPCLICADLKQAGSKNPKLTLFFSGDSGVSTLRRHIASMAGAHWEAYRSHCFDKKIMPNEIAVPSVVKLERDRKFIANEGSQSLITSYGKPTTTTQEPWTEEGLKTRLEAFILETDQALSICDKPAFIDLMMYQSKREASRAKPKDIPGRTTITNLVKERAHAIEKELAKRLKDAPGRVSLTFDGWTSAIMTAYIAVTVHYIDDQWKLISDLLSFAELPGSHSGENMGAHLFDVLRDFNILDKLGHTTSDNVSSNDVANRAIATLLKELSLTWDPKEGRIRCFSHIVNLAQGEVIKGLTLSKLKASTNLKTAPTLPDPQANADSEAEGEEEDEDEDEVLREIDGFDVDKASPFPAGSLLFKCRAFISKVRRTPYAKRYLRECCIQTKTDELELIAYVKTRWSSWYQVLCRLVKLEKAINRFTRYADGEEGMPAPKKGTPRYSAYEFMPTDWETIKLIIVVLKEADSTQQAFSSETESLLWQVLPAFDQFLAAWEEMARNVEFITLWSALERGIALIKKYYKRSGQSIVYPLCTILDPRDRGSYIEEAWSLSEYNNVKSRIEKVFLKYKTEHTANAKMNMQGALPTAESTLAPALDTHNYGIARRDAILAKRRAADNATLDELGELREYMEGKLIAPRDDFNLLGWWRDNAAHFPILAMMARDYLAVQGSAVPCERTFSSSKLTDTRLRCNLTSENFGVIQMAKSSLKKQRVREAREAAELEEARRDEWLAQEAEEQARHATKAGVVM